jgi:hypothetical protein
MKAYLITYSHIPAMQQVTEGDDITFDALYFNKHDIRFYLPGNCVELTTLKLPQEVMEALQERFDMVFAVPLNQRREVMAAILPLVVEVE